MTDAADIYPPTPANVPPALTAPTGTYKTRVVLVLASLFFFVALYLGLVVGSAYFSYWSFRQMAAPDSPAGTSYGYTKSTRERRSSRGWWIVPGIASALVCLFLVKGFFKRQRADDSMRVEITEQDEPGLFAFIRRLCQDTKAPFPHKVYLVPDVNAAVFYHSSILGLILPARKNLLIGLGLVNRLNLSEFKAVLAHEFGHFSQSSMKLGSYVYTSNRIVCDLVYGRGWLDDVIAFLRGIDIRIAIFAWGFTGLLWVLRKGMEGLYKGINFANSALSRQMEFNADLVAVSVTGSDGLVHGLARLDFANDALLQAWHDLSAAADHRLYTRDLFYHQTRAAEYLRTVRKDAKLGEPPPLPDDPAQKSQLFEPGDSGIPLMWATHPSNHDREQNAKRHYLRVALDERPAWTVFHDAAALREQVTRRFYEVVKEIKDPPLTDAETVQAFIDDEHAEMTYPERYHGMYDDRYVLPGDLDALMAAADAEVAGSMRLAEAQASIYSDEVKARMESTQEHRREQYLLSGLVSATLSLKGKDFPFRDGRYRAADAPRLLRKVEADLKDDHDWLNSVDRQVFVTHYAMARQLDAETCRALEERYRFHLGVQEILNQLIAHQDYVQQVLSRVGGERQVSEDVFQTMLGALSQARDVFEQKLAAADQLRLPSLKHMMEGEPLGKFLLDAPLVRPLNARTTSLDGKWIGEFLGQLNDVITKTRRIHFKSLGGILALQERITASWTGQYGPGQASEEKSCPASPSSADRPSLP